MTKKPRYTSEEKSIIQSYVRPNEEMSIETAHLIKEHLNQHGYSRSIDAIINKAKRMNKKVKKSIEQSTSDIKLNKVEWINNKTPELDWRNSLKQAAVYVERHKKTSSSQDQATVKINTSDPIAVVYSADWHLGSVSIDYDSLINHIEYILENDNLYIISNGDEVDNMQIFRNVSCRVQALPIREQSQTFGAIYNELCDHNKLLCSGHGNHSEEFEERNVGYSYIAMIKGSRVPYFNGMGKLDLQVNEQNYIHIISHKGKGNSQYNAVHGASKQAMMYCPQADVSVAGHTHNPCYSFDYGHRMKESKPVDLTFPHKPRVNIRTGTFKTSDPFSKRYFGQGRLGTPTVVFFPDRHEFVPFPTPQAAVAYMKGL